MPEWKSDVRARLASVRLAPAREAEIVEELAQHLDDRWRELVAGGVDPAEAERLTRAEFREGNLLARYLAPLRQAHWADPAPPRRAGLWGGLRTDLRDAIRSLRGAPGFTAVALIVLTLGMGATTAIFSVVDAVVLRPLPFDAPDELVAVGERRPTAGKLAMAPAFDRLALRYSQPQNYLDWVAQQQVFTGIAAVASADVTFLPRGAEPESVRAQRVTANFFDILRIRPAIGRAFSADAETEGRHRVAILSDAFWRRRFAADRGVVGRAIAFDDGSYVVIGVLAPGVSYPVGAAHAPDIWVPYVMPAQERERGAGHSIYLQCIARLKPGVTGVLFGILPAVRLSRPNLVASLNGANRHASASRRRQRMRRSLVAAEIALSVVLLVGAALFIGSFIRLMRVDSGFSADGVLTAQVYARRLPGAPALDFQFDRIVERLRSAEGVVRVAAVSPGIPLSPRGWIDGLNVPGRPADRTGVGIKVVTPEYHGALMIPLKRGRYFTADDRAGGPNVMLVSQSAANAYFPGEDPVGRIAEVARVPRTIVGVVGDVRQASLEEETANPEVYLPTSQAARGSGYLVIRTSGDPYSVLPAAKTIVANVLHDVPLREIASMDELVARQTAQRRLNMLMLGLFGLLGVVIAAVGLYGLMAFVVSQRAREIGVRMALGATRLQVIAMVLRNAAAMLGVGLAAGLTGAWYLGATATPFLFEFDRHDPRAFAAAALLLSMACLAATIVPARRAASVDPTLALRSE